LQWEHLEAAGEGTHAPGQQQRRFEEVDTRVGTGINEQLEHGGFLGQRTDQSMAASSAGLLIRVK
jgi:hypothetical protein